MPRIETETFKNEDYTLFWDQVLAQTDEHEADYADMNDRLPVASFNDYLVSLAAPF